MKFIVPVEFKLAQAVNGQPGFRLKDSQSLQMPMLPVIRLWREGTIDGPLFSRGTEGREHAREANGKFPGHLPER